MESHGEFFADKLMNLANLGVAATVFGQTLEAKFRWKLGFLGLGFFLFSVVVSWLFRKRGMTKR